MLSFGSSVFVISIPLKGSEACSAESTWDRKVTIRTGMRRQITIAISVFLTGSLWAEPLGFVQQRFSHVYFERGKWARVAQLPCFTYTATADGATVEFLAIGGSDLIPFRATKGLSVTVCGSSAAMEEGFEAGQPVRGAAPVRR